MKVFAFALRPYDELEYLKAEASRLGFEFDWTAEHLTLETAELAKGYDKVSLLISKTTRPILEKLASYGVDGIATRSIGFDHIDLQAAREFGMRVANAAYPPNGVANFAIMLMLETLRKVKYINRQSGAQNFDLKGKIGKDITSCTVGVVGTGRIGATVVEHLSGFGCKILAYDPYPNDRVRAHAEYVDLDTLLKESDAITLHVPAMAENEHMIDAAAIAKMKEGAVIINTARGSLIDTEALLDALESGHLGGAGLDAVEGEGKILYNDLRHVNWYDRKRAALEALPNVIVYPHMAFYTEEDVLHMVKSSSEALLAFAEGKETPFEVTNKG